MNVAIIKKSVQSQYSFKTVKASAEIVMSSAKQHTMLAESIIG